MFYEVWGRALVHVNMGCGASKSQNQSPIHPETHSPRIFDDVNVDKKQAPRVPIPIEDKRPHPELLPSKNKTFLPPLSPNASTGDPRDKTDSVNVGSSTSPSNIFALVSPNPSSTSTSGPDTLRLKSTSSTSKESPSAPFASLLSASGDLDSNFAQYSKKITRINSLNDSGIIEAYSILSQNSNFNPQLVILDEYFPVRHLPPDLTKVTSPLRLSNIFKSGCAPETF